MYGLVVLVIAKLFDTPTGVPLVASCNFTEPVPVPTYFPFTDTEMPVTIAPAGRLKAVPLARSTEEVLDDKDTVATEAPVRTKLLGLVQEAAPTLSIETEDGAEGPAVLFVPDTTEAYPVGLKILFGLSHEELVAKLPMLGPTNNPVEDTADAVKPLIGPSSA